MSSSATPVRVAVTGAAGQIGYSLLFRIASGSMLGPDTPIALQLLEITPALGALEGVRMELDDSAFPLLDSITCTDDADVAFGDADVALLVGAMPRKAGMERSDLLAANGGIFKPQGEALSRSASRDVKVLVVGNPANTNALIAMSNAPDLDPGRFTAMTRLDHNRAVTQIAQRLDASVNDVRRMTIWGNHSTTQYPDLFHCEVGGRNAYEAVGDHEWVDQTFIPTVAKRGALQAKCHEVSRLDRQLQPVGGLCGLQLGLCQWLFQQRHAQQQHVARGVEAVAVAQFARPHHRANGPAQQGNAAGIGLGQAQRIAGILAADGGQAAAMVGRNAKIVLGMDQDRQGLRIGPGQGMAQDARLRHGGNGRGRIGGAQELAHLGPDPFTREIVDSIGHFGAGGQALGIEACLLVAVMGVKAEEAQDAQVVFANAVMRVADEAKPPRPQVGNAAAQGVDHATRGIGIERVHGEVAAHGVFLHLVGEGDHRAAAIGFHVAAEGGDFVGQPVGDHGHGSVVDPGRHGLEPVALGNLHHPFGARIGGNVDVIRGQPKQPVPDAAADEERMEPLGFQRLAQFLRAGVMQPVGLEDHDATRSARPFSIRAVAPQM